MTFCDCLIVSDPSQWTDMGAAEAELGPFSGLLSQGTEQMLQKWEH